MLVVVPMWCRPRLLSEGAGQFQVIGRGRSNFRGTGRPHDFFRCRAMKRFFRRVQQYTQLARPKAIALNGQDSSWRHLLRASLACGRVCIGNSGNQVHQFPSGRNHIDPIDASPVTEAYAVYTAGRSLSTANRCRFFMKATGGWRSVLVGMPQDSDQSLFLPNFKIVAIEHLCSYVLGFFVIATV
jgi:hypothetical protein